MRPVSILEGDSVNKVTFKERMTENFPNLIKATSLHVQKAEEIPSGIDKKKSTKILRK